MADLTIVKKGGWLLPPGSRLTGRRDDAYGWVWARQRRHSIWLTEWEVRVRPSFYSSLLGRSINMQVGPHKHDSWWRKESEARARIQELWEANEIIERLTAR